MAVSLFVLALLAGAAAGSHITLLKKGFLGSNTNFIDEQRIDDYYIPDDQCSGELLEGRDYECKFPEGVLPSMPLLQVQVTDPNYDGEPPDVLMSNDLKTVKIYRKRKNSGVCAGAAPIDIVLSCLPFPYYDKNKKGNRN